MMAIKLPILLYIMLPVVKVLLCGYNVARRRRLFWDCDKAQRVLKFGESQLLHIVCHRLELLAKIRGRSEEVRGKLVPFVCP